MTGLYDRCLQSDHRFQAARGTCQRSGSALEVSGEANITGFLAGLFFYVILCAALGAAGYVILGLAGVL